MKPAKDLQQLETRVRALQKNYTLAKAEALDISTKGWSYCAVGLKLKEIGIDISVAKRNGCLGSQIVERVCSPVVKDKGSMFNSNLYSKSGITRCLNFIEYLRSVPTCQLLK